MFTLGNYSRPLQDTEQSGCRSIYLLIYISIYLFLHLSHLTMRKITVCTVNIDFHKQTHNNSLFRYWEQSLRLLLLTLTRPVRIFYLATLTALIRGGTIDLQLDEIYSRFQNRQDLMVACVILPKPIDW